MIIKQSDKFFSTEKIIKINIFSDSRAGNVFLHSRLVYPNPVLIDCCKEKFLQEVPLGVSERGALNFRRIGPQVNFLYAPIEGDFVLKDGKFEHLLGHLYRVLASDHEKSKRNISWGQLEEIRKNSNYQMKFEDDYYYRFLKLADCELEYRNSCHFYDFERLKMIKTSNYVVVRKEDRFYLKVPIESIEHVGIGKAGCGAWLEIYKIENSSLPNGQLNILVKLIKETPPKCHTQVEIGEDKFQCFYRYIQLYKNDRGYIGIEDGKTSDTVYLAYYSDNVQKFEKDLKSRSNVQIKVPLKFILNQKEGGD